MVENTTAYMNDAIHYPQETFQNINEQFDQINQQFSELNFQYNNSGVSDPMVHTIATTTAATPQAPLQPPSTFQSSDHEQQQQIYYDQNQHNVINQSIDSYDNKQQLPYQSNDYWGQHQQQPQQPQQHHLADEVKYGFL